MLSVNLYEAKTTLSALVDRAAKGEEIIICKAGKPLARLAALEQEPTAIRQLGGNEMGITYMAEDFDEPAFTDSELDEMGL